MRWPFSEPTLRSDPAGSPGVFPTASREGGSASLSSAQHDYVLKPFHYGDNQGAFFISRSSWSVITRPCKARSFQPVRATYGGVKRRFVPGGPGVVAPSDA
jgi:hypothetical protein